MTIGRKFARSAAAWLALCALPAAFLAVLLPVGSAFSPAIGLRGPGGVGGGGLWQGPAAAHQAGLAAPWACKSSRQLAVRAPARRAQLRVAPCTVLRAQADDVEDASSFSDALVDFKGAPCLVTSVSEKADILQLNRRTRKAKYKDLQIVFPGPVRSWELQELEDKGPEPAVAPEQVHAELLSEGGAWTVAQLAEKLFLTPPTHLTAWSAWTLVLQGLYFTGTAQEIVAHPADKVAKDLEKMRAKKAQEKDHADFVKRVRSKKIKPADIDRMQVLDVEYLSPHIWTYVYV